MNLSLLQCHPDSPRLAAWATRVGLATGGDDLGYALHALLFAVFGDAAPKPFRYFGDARGLLAYTTQDTDALKLAVQVAAPDVYAVLGLERFATRRFPDQWLSGQRLGFELRVRPVVRTSQGRERDAFLAAIDKQPDSELSREAVYVDWLRNELKRQGAAVLEYANLDAFRLSGSLRKGAATSGKRSVARVAGPDVLFTGELNVDDPVGFAALLSRGVGRHRAFGYGMLLLKPSAPC